jgi:DNA polymerase-3 subunit delta
MNIRPILSEIDQGKPKPVYFLTGEEPYFIDQIANYIEQKFLQASEKDFNQNVFYGRDVAINQIIDASRRFPVMAKFRLVIVKEAQELSRYIEKLVPYIQHASPTTVLVLCYKYKKIDKRKALYKSISKVGLFFESKRLYENQVLDFIKNWLKEKNWNIESKAAALLVEYLGTELSKVSNELNKLTLAIGDQRTITAADIEENIGISKEFNNFELRKAIGAKDFKKAHRIVNYFGENQKANPMVLTISMLFGYFTQLLTYHSLQDKSPKNVAQVLRINPYFVSDYTQAGKHYPMRKVSSMISILREADLKSKGLGANQLSPRQILKELIFRLMY